MQKVGRLTWLHISDLHAGHDEQHDLWPRFKTVFYDDIRRGIEKAGRIDIIIFSGDLVQKGSSDDFDRLNEILSELMLKIEWPNGQPKIVTTPGNHDLARPSDVDAYTFALKQFWQSDEIRHALWDKSTPKYLDFINNNFTNYKNWRNNAIKSGLHLAPTNEGIIIGDAAYTVNSEFGSLGLISLNSSWLQLGPGNYNNNLHVDVKQLHAVTDNDPDTWASHHSKNVLVTHHPAGWLRTGALSSWENDVNPTGRFDAHLFGHMHEPELSKTSIGGSNGKISIQAASLFGLEKYEEQYERIQGYSIGVIEQANSRSTLSIWPRRLQKIQDGRKKLVPDYSYEINEESGFAELKIDTNTEQASESTVKSRTYFQESTSLDVQDSVFDIDALRFDLGRSAAQTRVRRIEHQDVLAAFATDRAAWLTSDWGMGRDGFLSTVCDAVQIRRRSIFSFNIRDFTKTHLFLDEIKDSLGKSFQEICELISTEQKPLIVFSDLESSIDRNIVLELENLADAVKDFVPNSVVLIHSRRKVNGEKLRVITLNALDEADVGLYACDSELGDERYGRPDAASILFRHTDGLPIRIDAALRNLEFVSLQDLIESNPDFGDMAGAGVAAPPHLIAAVTEMKMSHDKFEQRAFQLLVALSALPQGEKLSRIKRFLGVHPFGLQHARVLLESGLIDAIQISSMTSGEDSGEKVLVVSRVVREVVRDSVDPEKLLEADGRALDILFSVEWASGEINNSPIVKRVKVAICDTYQIHNAITLINRLIRRCLDSGSEIEIASSIRLTSAFIAALLSGDHFRHAAELCGDVIRLIEEYQGHEKELAVFSYQYGRALRMTGDTARAMNVYESVNLDLLPRDQRQAVHLGMALCAQRLNDPARAIKSADDAIKISPKTAQALQAKCILAELQRESEDQENELRKILATAVKSKSNVIANNVRITLAESGRLSSKEIYDILMDVVSNARSDNDYYNLSRATIKIATLRIADGGMSQNEKTKLMEVYHYLYNERLIVMLNTCHDALWTTFDSAGEKDNLLNLFRKSSFVWRLSGSEEKEKSYLSRLTLEIGNVLTQRVNQLTKDALYFLIRTKALLGS